MRLCAIIDTHVLVSALLKQGSPPNVVVRAVFEGHVIPVMNTVIFSEYTQVLYRPKFHFEDSIVETVLREMRRAGVFIDAPALLGDFADPKDKVFWEVLTESRKNEDVFLVTGNIKHFPDESFIITPRQMTNIITSYTHTSFDCP